VNTTLRVCVLMGLLGSVFLQPLVHAQARVEGTGANGLSTWFKTPDQRAKNLMDQERYQDAAEVFEDDQWRGVSQYRDGNFEEALKSFSSAARAVDSAAPNSTKATGFYNEGTTAIRAGDYTQGVESLQQALELDPTNDNIKHNLGIAKKAKKLADQQNAQQNQPQNGQEQSSEDRNDQQNGDESQTTDSGDNSDSTQQSSPEDQSSNNAQTSDEQKDSDQPSDDDFEDTNEAQTEEDAKSEAGQLPQATDEAMTEDDQATQQWLRKIPDDPSILLRNKIRLNYQLEYPDVNHMDEPW